MEFKGIEEPTITNAGSEVNENVASARTKLKQLIIIEETKAKKHEKTAPWERERTTPPKIQRVPSFLRDQINSEKYYEPQWISIGPIYHGYQKLRLAENRYKLDFAVKFIYNSGNQSEDDFYKEIKENIEELKNYFDEEVLKEFDDKHHRNDPEAFGWMLFLDGCFVLQFIHSYIHGELSTFNIKTDQIVLVFHDFFLLENQIPFQVLKLLMDNLRNEDFGKELWTSLKDFIHVNVTTPPKFKRTLDFRMDTIKDHPAHLLDLLRMALLHQSYNKFRLPRNFYAPLLQRFTLKFRPRTENTQIIPRVIRHKTPQKTDLNPSKIDDDGGRQSFRTVMDLKAAGIHFKPSKTCSLRSINFSVPFFQAHLELPALIIDDLTVPKFLNLIAYEMCPDNIKTEYEVTSYISFLDTLIDYPHDVKELRSAKILHNYLGDDREVAWLFNQMGKFTVPNPQVYNTVISQIERYYESNCMAWLNRFRIWMNQLSNDYFNSPWTILALLAAILALGLSGIQTWYTVYSPPGPCDNFCYKLKRL